MGLVASTSFETWRTARTASSGGPRPRQKNEVRSFHAKVGVAAGAAFFLLLTPAHNQVAEAMVSASSSSTLPPVSPLEHRIMKQIEEASTDDNTFIDVLVQNIGGSPVPVKLPKLETRDVFNHLLLTASRISSFSNMLTTQISCSSSSTQMQAQETTEIHVDSAWLATVKELIDEQRAIAGRPGDSGAFLRELQVIEILAECHGVTRKLVPDDINSAGTTTTTPVRLLPPALPVEGAPPDNLTTSMFSKLSSNEEATTTSTSVESAVADEMNKRMNILKTGFPSQKTVETICTSGAVDTTLAETMASELDRLSKAVQLSYIVRQPVSPMLGVIVAFLKWIGPQGVEATSHRLSIEETVYSLNEEEKARLSNEQTVPEYLRAAIRRFLLDESLHWEDPFERLRGEDTFPFLTVARGGKNCGTFEHIDIQDVDARQLLQINEDNKKDGRPLWATALRNHKIRYDPPDSTNSERKISLRREKYVNAREQRQDLFFSRTNNFETSSEKLSCHFARHRRAAASRSEHDEEDQQQDRGRILEDDVDHDEFTMILTAKTYTLKFQRRYEQNRLPPLRAPGRAAPNPVVAQDFNISSSTAVSRSSCSRGEDSREEPIRAAATDDAGTKINLPTRHGGARVDGLVDKRKKKKNDKDVGARRSQEQDSEVGVGDSSPRRLLYFWDLHVAPRQEIAFLNSLRTN